MKRLVLALVSVVLCAAPAVAGTCDSHTVVAGPVQYVEQPCIAVPNQRLSPCANCPGMQPIDELGRQYCVREVQYPAYAVQLRGRHHCKPVVFNAKRVAVPRTALAPTAPAPVAPAPVAPAPVVPPHIAPPHVAPPSAPMRMAAPPRHVSAPVTGSAPSHSGGGGKP